MSTPKTLLALLNQYKIEIPRVQRDYVQGRKDERSKIVRTNLLNDIKAAYEGRIDPLFGVMYLLPLMPKKLDEPNSSMNSIPILFPIHRLPLSLRGLFW